MLEEVNGIPRQMVVAYLKKRKTLDEALDMVFDVMVHKERLTKEVRDLQHKLDGAEAALRKIRKTIGRLVLSEDGVAIGAKAE